MGCHSLLQGIFPIQGSNLALLHCRQTLYNLSHQGINKCKGSLYSYKHRVSLRNVIDSASQASPDANGGDVSQISDLPPYYSQRLRWLPSPVLLPASKVIAFSRIWIWHLALQSGPPVPPCRIVTGCMIFVRYHTCTVAWSCVLWLGCGMPGGLVCWGYWAGQAWRGLPLNKGGRHLSARRGSQEEDITWGWF